MPGQTFICVLRTRVNAYEDNRVGGQYREDEGMTILGGTVHIFRGCIRNITDSIFCYNAGVPKATTLAPKGALFIESPSCALQLETSYFEGNVVPLDGAALQV
jgi:hypothetical protein